MSEAAFDYSRAARDAGWYKVDLGIFAEEHWINAEGGCFAGNVRELCFFICKGPEWEAWTQEPYELSKAGLAQRSATKRGRVERS